MRNKGIFRILFFVLSTSYVEIILEATISRVFPTHLYHVVFQLVKNILSLDVTMVFLRYMEKLVCSNTVITTRKRSGSNTDSNQGAIGEKICIYFQ